MASPTRGPTVRLLTEIRQDIRRLYATFQGPTDVIQLHDYIRTDGVLYRNAFLWLGIATSVALNTHSVWQITVNMVGSPVKGLENRAPSSVMVVNLLRETSWKPPLS